MRINHTKQWHSSWRLRQCRPGDAGFHRTMQPLSDSRGITGLRKWTVTAARLVCALGMVQVTGLAHAQTSSTGVTPPPATVSAKGPQPARQWVTPAAGDVQKGAALYQSLCTACHAVDSNKIGPAHRGVMGRRVGSLAGYKYSSEVASSRLRWTPQTLNAWLEDPEELVPGQRMGFQVDSAQDRADLIAYLSTLK